MVGASTLAEAAAAVRGRRSRRTLVAMPRVTISGPAPTAETLRARQETVAAPDVPDLAEVRGQHEARRALEIALAGGHGMLMTGPPGVGKTLLARTIPGLLPPLDDAAALSVSIVASAAGEGPVRELRRQATVSSAASHAVVCGHGRRRTGPHTGRDHPGRRRDPVPRRTRRIRPRRPRGAAPATRGGAGRDRAGRAVDDVPRALPAVRRHESRARAGSPAPCRKVAAVARPARCERYARRVSGPLRDRIDLWVTMPRIPASAIVATREPEGSSVVGQRIAAARAVPDSSVAVSTVGCADGRSGAPAG